MKRPAKNFLNRIIYRVSNLKKSTKMKSCFPKDFNPDAVKIIELVQSFTMTSPERINGLIEAVRYITENRISGAVVECGVWKGGSMMAAAHMLKEMSDVQRELYLFDTYSGMSAPTKKDVTHFDVHAQALLDSDDPLEKEAYHCYSSLEEVQENLSLTNYPPGKIHFIKGKVEDTIPAQAPEKIALLRLDTDWYESTKHELEHLFPRLVSGGVIIIDDYGYWKGCKEATDEYIEFNKIPLLLNRIDSTGRMGIKWQS